MTSSQKDKKNRYKHVDGKRLIEVRVKNTLQLFDARDPAPFRERDLDDDFVEYITTSARESGGAHNSKIVIYIEEVPSKDLSAESIKESIQNYLDYKIDLQQSNLKIFIKRAQYFLLIGLLVLAACIGVAQNLIAPSTTGWKGVLREGIVIFGWVSIWKPIELILFDWFPLYEQIKLFKVLRDTEIEIIFSANSNL